MSNRHPKRLINIKFTVESKISKGNKVTRKKKKKPSLLPQILILGGVILLAVSLLAVKNVQNTASTAVSSELPEIQLNAALNAHKPTLAFFHSNDCEQCIIMIDVVEQVYPEFAKSIELVDINVYDENNEPLLRKVGLQYIPTLVFFDQQGNGETYVGVMSVEELRGKFSALLGDK